MTLWDEYPPVNLLLISTKLTDLLKVPSVVLLAGFRQKHPPEVLYIIGVLENFAKLIGKYLCQKKDSGTGVYLWIFQNF